MTTGYQQHMCDFICYPLIQLQFISSAQQPISNTHSTILPIQDYLHCVSAKHRQMVNTKSAKSQFQ